MSESTPTNQDPGPKPEQALAALNNTKLELALVVLLCVIAMLLTLRLPLAPLLELTVLASIGAAGAGWVILRTRRAVRRMQASLLQGGADGAP